MTINEFVAELSSIEGKWYLSDCDSFLRRVEDRCCPIEAVLKSRGCDFDWFGIESVGKELEMSEETILSIMRASDNNNFTEYRWLRKELLHAVLP